MTQKLQFEDKTAVFATAYYRGTSLDDTSFTTIVVPVPGVSLSEAEAQMDAVLEEFMETPIDQAHLARIKSQMRASRIYAKDNVQGLANSYGRALTSGLTIADILAWPDVVESITEEDIKSAMRTVLNNKSSVTGWLTSGREAAQ
jgi:zinc protease